jgi:hypothetical protein
VDRAAGDELRGRPAVVADRQVRVRGAERLRDDRGRDADRADRLLRGVHLPDQPGDLGVDVGRVPLLGEVREVLRRAEPAGHHERVEVLRAGVLDVLDLPARDPRGLD